jgi:hypothetical protein
MIKLSTEQEEIVNTVSQDNSLIVVDAVPGSGKTSVVLSIAKKYAEEKSIWCFTFNNQLAAEVQDKIIHHELSDNINVSTYHGFGKTYYNNDMLDDSCMFHVIQDDQKPIKELPFIDVLVVDETQDMKPLYFYFIQKVMNDSFETLKRRPRVILTLGDKRQNIYDFMGSDSRFLTMAEHMYPCKEKVFHLKLTQSFRLTNEIATFLNNSLKGTEIVAHRKSGHRPCYLVGNPYSCIDLVLESIQDMGTSPEDLFFLFPSVRGQLVRVLENKLSEKKIRCVVSRSETGMLDDKVIKGKAVISTFHQSKGRERPVVVVFGFDKSYFDFFARDTEDTTQVPPPMYVAMTRASEKLFLIQHSKQLPMPFLQDGWQDHVDYINLDPPIPIPVSASIKSSSSSASSSSSTSSISLEHYTSPSKVVEFIPQEAMLQIALLFEKVFTLECEKHVEVVYENTVLGADKKTYEDVADLNGIAIPFKFETEKKDNKIENTVIMKRCDEKLKKMLPSVRKYYLNHMKSYLDSRTEETQQADFFFYANLYRSLTTGYRYYLEQLDTYDYALPVLEKLMNNLRRHVRKPISIYDFLSFEVPLEIRQDRIDDFIDTHFGLAQMGRVIFTGADIDIMDSQNVWEVKCVELIQNEHKLQLVVYAWLYLLSRTIPSSAVLSVKKNFFLLNARNGQLWRLDISKVDVLEEIMRILFRSKYLDKEVKLKDKDFLEKHLIFLKKS